MRSRFAKVAVKHRTIDNSARLTGFRFFDFIGEERMQLKAEYASLIQLFQ